MAAKVIGNIYGPVFRSKTGSVSTESICGDGKIICAYFSGEWCAPCKDFLPKLLDFYEDCRQRKDRDFEVIFVSMDKTMEDFENYYKKMPWLTMDQYSYNGQHELKERLKVFGLPHLMVYDGHTGDLLTEHGVAEVTHDPLGNYYPWHDRSFTEFMEIGELVNSSGAECKFSSLSDSIKGFYFAGNWSEPCKVFTKKLVKAYENVRKAGHKFEVIYISMDKDEKSFKKTIKTMPWLTLPWNDRRRGRVQFDYGVMGVPKLIIVNDENRVITFDGRGSVSTDADGVEFPWKPKPYSELTPDTVGPLNDAKCLVIFGPSAQKDSMIEALKHVANEQLEKGKDRELQFYYALVDGEHQQTIKLFLKFMKIKKPAYPLTLVTFLRESAYFPLEGTELSAEIINGFVDKFLAGGIERVTVSVDQAHSVAGVKKK